MYLQLDCCLGRHAVNFFTRKGVKELRRRRLYMCEEKPYAPTVCNSRPCRQRSLRVGNGPRFAAGIHVRMPSNAAARMLNLYIGSHSLLNEGWLSYRRNGGATEGGEALA
jgi:hypothetical protein